MTEHRYDDDEVHAIFTRAAERQEEAEQAEAASQAGSTLSELQQIGAEAGIDPEHVADAARALAFRESGGAVTEPSNPWEICHSRSLPGPVSDRAWEQIVGELRRAFKKNGSESQFGESREWFSGDDVSSKPIRLRIEPSAGSTRVTVHQDFRSELRTVSWGGALILGVSLVGRRALEGGIVAWTWIGAFGVGTLLFLAGTRLLFKRTMAKQVDHFSAVTDRIELIVRRDTMVEGNGDK